MPVFPETPPNVTVRRKRAASVNAATASNASVASADRRHRAEWPASNGRQNGTADSTATHADVMAELLNGRAQLQDVKQRKREAHILADSSLRPLADTLADAIIARRVRISTSPTRDGPTDDW